MTGSVKLTQYSHGGGCGCKIAPSVLAELLAAMPRPPSYPNLLVGTESSDDAAVYKLNESQAIVVTTDFFMPIVDDARDFGRIPATNALSDVYAMGATPILALAGNPNGLDASDFLGLKGLVALSLGGLSFLLLVTLMPWWQTGLITAVFAVAQTAGGVMVEKDQILAPDVVEKHILLIRGQKVLLDADLARLYGVPTGRLNEQVRRNLKRFPADFMFELTMEEYKILRSQFAISSAHFPDT